MLKPFSRSNPKVISIPIAIICAGLSSCKSPHVQPIEIINLEDFEATLQEAGAQIQTGEAIPVDLFDVPGQVLLLNGNEIEVYEYPSQTKREAVSNSITTRGLVAGGILTEWDVKPTIWGEGSLIVVYWGYDGGVILLISGLMGDPLTYEAPKKDEPYPPAVVAAIRHLADDHQIAPELIQVLDFTPLDWPDSCLGIIDPDEQCTQTQISGWRVMLKASGEVYELRTDLAGDRVRQAR